MTITFFYICKSPITVKGLKCIFKQSMQTLSLFWIGWIALDIVVYAVKYLTDSLEVENYILWFVVLTDCHNVNIPIMANFNLPLSLWNSSISAPTGLCEPGPAQCCSGTAVNPNLTCLIFLTYQKICLTICSLKYISSSWFHASIMFIS